MQPAGRGPEHRVAALTLAALLFVGGLMGLSNLLVDGVLRDGAPRWIYGTTMLLCMAAAVPLAVRRRVGPVAAPSGSSLLGDLIYLVVVLCIEDPVRYATPLMLLFPAFVGRLVPGAVGAGRQHGGDGRWSCLLALWPSYDSAAGLAVQVVVSAGTLNAGALGVFLLRRRVQRLLDATQALSLLDPLTGLANRRYLVEQAPRMWRQARRDGTRVAAMVLDIDHFKRLNDAHGHAAGDAVLCAVARSLAATVRPADVLARTGGEELVVLGLVGDPGRGAAAGRASAPRGRPRPHPRRPRRDRLHRGRAHPAGRRRGRGRRTLATGRPGRRGDVRGQAAGPRPGGGAGRSARPVAAPGGARGPARHGGQRGR